MIHSGLDIPSLNASTACSDKQPLMSNLSYGFIESLDFDGFHFYGSRLNCSWLLIAEEPNSISIRFLVLELDVGQTDGLNFYNDFSPNATLLKHFSGSQRHLSDWTSPGNVLYIRFFGASKPRSVGFSLYFERIPTPVRCQSSQIECRNGYKCVDLKQKCNGVDDCEDGTDEQNCPMSSDQLNFKNVCGRPRIEPNDDLNRIVGGSAAKPGLFHRSSL